MALARSRSLELRGEVCSTASVRVGVRRAGRIYLIVARQQGAWRKLRIE
jgi:hypothetical protein